VETHEHNVIKHIISDSRTSINNNNIAIIQGQ
jgi:hypothetical protein